MRYRLLATLILIGPFLAARGLEAQEIRSPYRYIDPAQSFGAYVGQLFADAGSPAVGAENAPLFGLRYNLRFTGPLSGEAAIGFSPSERQVMAFDTVAGAVFATGETADMSLLLLEGGLRFHLTGPRTWNNLAPYVVATGGLASDLSGAAPADEELPAPQRFRFGTSFALGVGIGTDLFVTDRLSLRVEARDHILRLRMPAGLRQTTRDETQWTNNFGVTVGTAFHF